MNNELVAFNPTDADALLNLIEGAGGQSFAAARGNNFPNRFGLKWGQTTEAVLPANSVGTAWLQTPTDTAPFWANYVQVDVWNRGPAIPANTTILLLPIDGRWCVFDVCLGT